ncbi:alpha/beta hydrolase [Parvularcula dongshanensis]|uniref:Enterochelin esterase-like enzyme n=1 Tax=Parvularcula dongshanensis TaxID=1173995 RepID=A0A840I5L8_9PROT|nr:alpha/beta fold hydrolase [Parvularcula dongshanensis]MBB4659692.1 enterochelin esterase-like enzyme [Parvularcula dongshanensis]
MTGVCTAQDDAAGKVRTERLVVDSHAIAGNLEGNAAERDVIVYLPPSYDAEPERRFPVVYALHGYSIDNDIWTNEIDTPAGIEDAFANGTAQMIVVLPDSRTRHNGSMYSSSVTVGDWESFIADELVEKIDATYRTLAARESRGLAGHSMGGYGTIRIGMKRPDVFGALYSMSPCCLSARAQPPADLLERLEGVRTEKDAAALGFFERATLASAAAWSPDPNAPPFYLRLPVGENRTEVLARWAANAPIAMVDQYVPELRSYSAIAIDVGDKDGLRADAEILARDLQHRNIPATYEVYEGDHVSGVADRFERHVLPFFARHLVADAETAAVD